MNESLINKNIDEFTVPDCIVYIRNELVEFKVRAAKNPDYTGRLHREVICSVCRQLRNETQNVSVRILARRISERATHATDVEYLYADGIRLLDQIEQRINEESGKISKSKTRYDILKERMDTPMGMAKVLLGYMDDAIRCGKMNHVECQTCSPADVLKVITAHLETEVTEDTFMLDGIPHGRGGLGE